MQGLRVIKTVTDLKGEKRFKRIPKGLDNIMSNETNMDTLDTNTAKKVYRSTTNKPAYQWQHGERPKAATDHQVSAQ